MGETVKLTANDGHSFDAYVARPAEQPKAGLVVVQEIFGVNVHIRGVADSYAAEGFLAIAPALFDRVEPGIELGYDKDDIAQGRAIRRKIDYDQALADIAAAMGFLAGAGKVGVIGYCWGGSLAWLAATRLNPAAAVGYYGGDVYEFRNEQPTCPVMLHFGEEDSGIPLDQVKDVAEAQSEAEIFTYPGAGHGFNCEMRGSYHAESAGIARERTLAFLNRCIV
ncbi:MAG: dienelactone hydrolase family protein [Kiloniellaceae bacterium]